nr:HAMP domain-containing sensor histidine kinase [uncultured Aminipila sp.]
MKNSIFGNKSHEKLIRKIFFKSLVLFLVAITSVIVLRSAGRGYIGNIITEIICRVTGAEWEMAAYYYFKYIRTNIDTIMMLTSVTFFIILFRFSLFWFTKYFDVIVEGVEQLANEDGNKIVMTSELDFMEEKLNQVKNELAKRAEAKEEAEKRKNDLVIYLAHDIKTPLTSVIGYLSLLDETIDMPLEQKAKYVHITLEKAYRLEKLINEFFEITRYNLESIPLNKESIDLYYMFVQIADEAYPALVASNKKVKIHASENLTIFADSEKLARVFNNILKNAISYSPPNSIIDIYGEIQGSNAIIRFENPGVIPKEKIDVIFEKFYRLDYARSTATGGAGLGLAIAKDIIKLHGGSIEASCEDAKIIFKITLPNI